MKKSDIAMIILIASISVLIAYFVAKGIFGGSAVKPVSVDTTTPISSSLTQPDTTVFNSNAINPTVEVTIGNGTSSAPALRGQ